MIAFMIMIILLENRRYENLIDSNFEDDRQPTIGPGVLNALGWWPGVY